MKFRKWQFHQRKLCDLTCTAPKNSLTSFLNKTRKYFKVYQQIQQNYLHETSLFAFALGSYSSLTYRGTCASRVTPYKSNTAPAVSLGNVKQKQKMLMSLKGFVTVRILVLKTIVKLNTVAYTPYAISSREGALTDNSFIW